MRYLFECKACRADIQVFRSITEGPPASVPCLECGKDAERVWTAPEIHVACKPLDFSYAESNLGAAVGRSPDEQRRKYGAIIDSVKKVNREKQRSCGKRRDGGVNIVAEIPREVYEKREDQFGRGYWHAEGDKALKREGLI